MNRDDMPDGAQIALATGEMMVTARRLIARLPRLAESDPGQLLAAYAVVRAGTGELWQQVTPEAVRDVMLAAAEMAADHSVTELPEALARETAGPASAIAVNMLELTGEWITAGRPAAGPGGFTPPFAFASSAAFDREEDDQALSATAALLTLAHLVIPDQPPAGDDLDDDYEPCDHDCDEDCEAYGCHHEHCWKCGGCGCPGYCDDYQTYNLRSDETGGVAP